MIDLLTREDINNYLNNDRVYPTLGLINKEF